MSMVDALKRDLIQGYRVVSGVFDWVDNPITYASGFQNYNYVDTRRLVAWPKWRQCAAELAVHSYEQGLPMPEVVLGVESGGILPAGDIGAQFGVPTGIVRKAAKGHGNDAGRIAGVDVEGLVALVVEDVTTTGGSSVSAAQAVRAAGAMQVIVLTLLDRSWGHAKQAMQAEGFEFLALLQLLDLAKTQEDKLLFEHEERRFHAFMEAWRELESARNGDEASPKELKALEEAVAEAAKYTPPPEG